MAMKNYRDEPATSANRKLLIAFAILLVVCLFLWFVYPGYAYS